MDQSTTRVIPDVSGSGERTCTCGQERAKRQNSSRSPQSYGLAGVTNPPRLFQDSTENQDSDLITGSAGSPVLLEAQLQVAQRQIAQLLREKQDAFRQVKEVTKMNTRWQKYDKEREDVVADLTARSQRDQERIRDLKETVQRLQAKIAEHRSRNEELELRWTDARVRASERKSELERVQRESKTLELNLKQSEKKRHETSRRLEVAMKQDGAKRDEDGRGKKDADKDRDLYHMGKRVVDLKEKVEHLEKQLTKCKKQTDEQVDLYTQQISICLDDFKQEKRDKDRTKKENDDLKKQLKKAEDFASSLKVQITRYQDQQRVRPKRIQPSAHLINKYYGNIYEELDDDSWDDAGYALPSDVVPDRGMGFDEPDLGVAKPGHARGAAAMDLPPQYDDRSVLGQVIASPKASPHGARTRPDDLVLH